MSEHLRLHLNKQIGENPTEQISMYLVEKSVSWTDPVAQASPRVPNQAANHEDTHTYHMMTIQSRSDDIKAPKNAEANIIINRKQETRKIQIHTMVRKPSSTLSSLDTPMQNIIFTYL